MQEAKLLEGKVEKYEVAKRDCALLMPDGQPENNSRIAELTAQQTALEAELVEHEAKNRLYLLLAQRTRHRPPWQAGRCGPGSCLMVRGPAVEAVSELNPL